MEDCQTIFYKDRWMNENGLEQHLIVTFSLKYRDYQRKIRGRQIEKANRSLEKSSSLKRKSPHDYKRLITEEHITKYGEVAEKSLIELDMKKIADHEIISTLRDMNMLLSPGEGYIPTYERTNLTDALHEISGFRTDYEIISNRNIKKICTMIKKKKK